MQIAENKKSRTLLPLLVSMMLAYLALPFFCTSTLLILLIYALMAILAFVMYQRHSRLHLLREGEKISGPRTERLLPTFRTYAFIIFIFWSTLGSLILSQQLKIQKEQGSLRVMESDFQKRTSESIRKNGLMTQMAQLMDQVDEEIRANPGQEISDELIQRISRLSYAFHPQGYQYLDPDPEDSSRERGLLLIALAKMPLNDQSFAKIKATTDFSGANLQRADLHGLNLSGVKLICANLRDANLAGTNFSYADLKGADLWGAKMDSTDLSFAFLNRSDMQWAELNNAQLTWTTLKQCDLRSAKLRKSDLTNAILDIADLRGATLKSATMKCTSLVGANLDETILDSVNLEQADLRLASLGDVSLKEANLDEVILGKTKVRESDWLQQLQVWNIRGRPALFKELEMTADKSDKNHYLISVKRR